MSVAVITGRVAFISAYNTHIMEQFSSLIEQGKQGVPLATVMTDASLAAVARVGDLGISKMLSDAIGKLRV